MLVLIKSVQFRQIDSFYNVYLYKPVIWVSHADCIDVVPKERGAFPLQQPFIPSDKFFLCIQVAEWKLRAEKFQDMCCSVIHMFTRLSNTANRTILFDLYPYIWDIKSIMSMVKSFVLWLGTYWGALGPLCLCQNKKQPSSLTSAIYTHRHIFFFIITKISFHKIRFKRTDTWISNWLVAQIFIYLRIKLLKFWHLLKIFVDDKHLKLVLRAINQNRSLLHRSSQTQQIN